MKMGRGSLSATCAGKNRGQSDIALLSARAGRSPPTRNRSSFALDVLYGTFPGQVIGFHVDLRQRVYVLLRDAKQSAPFAREEFSVCLSSRIRLRWFESSGAASGDTTGKLHLVHTIPAASDRGGETFTTISQTRQIPQPTRSSGASRSLFRRRTGLP